MLNVLSHRLYLQTSMLDSARSTGTTATKRLARRTAERALEQLDDEALKDIGLHRTEIQSALVNRGNERRNGGLRAH